MRMGGLEQVPALVLLVDASTGAVAWSSDEALAPHAADGPHPSLTDVLQLPESDGIDEALREVARTGAPQHLTTPLVSTARATVSIVVSLFAIPDDARILVLAYRSWQPRAGEHRSEHRKRRHVSRRRSQP